MTDRYLNLVFQGGGVKGIAYAGVLDSMPSWCRIHGVGGTSAGSIVAALLAVDIRGDKLKEILEDRELYRLLHDDDVARFARIKAAWAKASNVFDNILKNKQVSWSDLWNAKDLSAIVKDLAAVWNEKGLHRSDGIRTWLDRQLGDRRFSDAVVEDLRIVAADVKRQEFVIFNKREHGGKRIAEAVHASISYPIFFQPLALGTEFQVDGGILSNFPSFLFAQGKYPTIGFRLGVIEPPGKIDSTGAFLKALVLTMAEAHDKHRGEPRRRFKSYTIPLPKGIDTLKFDLNEDEVKALYKAGESCAGGVDWEGYSSETPVVSYYDPDADGVLQFSLEQANALREKFSEESMWVESIRHDVCATFRIEQDWSVSYERDGLVTVEGQTPLFLMKSWITGAWARSGAPVSLLDVKYVCEEIVDGVSKEIIRIPALNTDEEKGFILCLVPPISQGKPRRIRTGFRVDREFTHTLAKGEPDVILYGQQQVGKTHRLKLKFRILVDEALPPLSFKSQFGKAVVEAGQDTDPTTGRKYKAFECDAGERSIEGVLDLPIRVTRGRSGAKSLK